MTLSLRSACVLAVVAVAASTTASQAAKPVRPASTSIVNAPPPRGVPGPEVGAGLPACVLVGGLAWFVIRRSRKPAGER